MTEKRFTMTYGKYQDHLEDKEYDEKWESWKICMLLNELHEENEHLKSEIENNIKNYKQSNRRVFDLIDKKIKEVDTIGAEVLKDLRRELIE